ncbi:MAG: hypothetical protein US15_C0073G0006 [Candidatus Moranbacteria bacterium GW2011_GWF1_36_4]|nr:MAG: hypothetical protein US15_C0073G0006 [Candidatus Moranbacteria bacterium GW2011_GWF1_36_4]
MSQSLDKKVRRVVFKSRVAEANLILESLQNSNFATKLSFCLMVFFRTKTRFSANIKGQLVLVNKKQS